MSFHQKNLHICRWSCAAVLSMVKVPSSSECVRCGSCGALTRGVSQSRGNNLTATHHFIQPSTHVTGSEHTTNLLQPLGTFHKQVLCNNVLVSRQLTPAPYALRSGWCVLYEIANFLATKIKAGYMIKHFISERMRSLSPIFAIRWLQGTLMYPFMRVEKPQETAFQISQASSGLYCVDPTRTSPAAELKTRSRLQPAFRANMRVSSMATANVSSTHTHASDIPSMLRKVNRLLRSDGPSDTNNKRLSGLLTTNQEQFCLVVIGSIELVSAKLCVRPTSYQRQAHKLIYIYPRISEENPSANLGLQVPTCDLSQCISLCGLPKHV